MSEGSVALEKIWGYMWMVRGEIEGVYLFFSYGEAVIQGMAWWHNTLLIYRLGSLEVRRNLDNSKCN